MSNFTIHDKNSAPAAAQETLKAVEKKFGFIPNLLGGLSESPATAKAYATLSGIFDSSSFDATERQVILLTVSRIHECHYCMAAHSTAAEMQKVPQDVIDALRSGGSIDDERLEALRKFTSLMVEKRGGVNEDAVQNFLDAGYSKAQVFEVVTGIALKTISNYSNHILDTPVDEPFQAKVWKKAS